MVVKILCFDPGLTVLGWSFGLFDCSTGKLNITKYGNFKPSATAMKKDKINVDIFGRRMIALEQLEEEVIRLIDLTKPDYVASEDVFLNTRNIQSFAALTLCLHSIRHAAKTRGKLVYCMAPMYIKKVISGIGNADKLAVQNAVLANTSISIVETKQQPLDKLCEHEADSIAGNYSFAMTILPTLLNTESVV